MAFRNKEDTIKEAERLGIDVTGMDWPAMQNTSPTPICTRMSPRNIQCSPVAFDTASREVSRR